jgi:hypothetical protein
MIGVVIERVQGWWRRRTTPVGRLEVVYESVERELATQRARLDRLEAQADLMSAPSARSDRLTNQKRAPS